MAEIENLSIVLSANASAAIAEIEKLASALGKFSTASRNAGGAAKQTGDEVKDMGSVTDKAASQTGEAADKAETAANKFASIGAALKGFGGRISSIAKGIGIAGKAFTAIPGYFGGKFITSIKNAAMAVANFFGQIKRVAMYRLIRTAIKFITQSFQEGMKNLYAWSNAVNGQFARSMDTLSTASKYAGNSIAAMASPLINALAPAIDFVVDKLVDMFNLFNQIFARLAGQTSYTAARKVASQWQDASESASGSASRAADKIKRTILGFDEINKLNDANASSGGGGGGSGGSGSSGADMFETRQIDGAVSTFVDQIRAAFEAGDWQGLGTTLGEKINGIVNSIDFASAGRTVGYYINGWFSTKYWTLETINFTNIGSSIATFLNNMIGQIDFETLGRLAVQKFTIVASSIIGFLETFDWGQAADKLSKFAMGIFNQLSKFLQETDWESLGTTIVNGIVDFFTNADYEGLAQSASEFLGSALGAAVKLITGLGKAIGEKIGEAFNGIGEFFNEQIEACGGDIVGGILRGIIVGLTNIGVWIVENIFKPFLNGFKKAFGIASPAKTMEEPGENIVLGILQGIVNALKSIGKWIKDNIFDPFISVLTGNSDWNADLINVGKNIIKKIGEGLGSIYEWFKEKFASALTAINAIDWVDTGKKVLKAIGEGIGSVYDWFKKKFAFALTGIRAVDWYDTGNKVLKAIGNGIGSVYDWFKKKFAFALTGIKSVDWYDTGNKILKAIGNGIGSVYDWFKKKFAFAITGIKAVDWYDVGNKILKTIGNGIGSVYDWFKKKFAFALTGIKSVDWYNTGNKILKAIGDGIGSVYEWFKKKFAFATTGIRAIDWLDAGKKIISTIGSGIGLVSTWFKDKFSYAITGIKNVDWASAGQKVISKIGDGIGSVSKWFRDKFNYGLSAIKALSWKSIGSTIWEKIKLGLGDLVEKFKAKFKEPINAVIRFINQLISKTETGINNVIDGINSKLTIDIQMPGWLGGGRYYWSPSIQHASFGRIDELANGGVVNKTGSLFLAGEAGPEIVGHVGGRTEVLNQSQLAAAMYSAVHSAMNGVSLDATFYNDNSEQDYEAMYNAVYDAMAAALAKGEALDRDRNNILREINSKEFTQEFSTSGLTQSLERKNRRAGTTVVPVMG
jgi:hypothetical protein